MYNIIVQQYALLSNKARINHLACIASWVKTKENNDRTAPYYDGVKGKTIWIIEYCYYKCACIKKCSSTVLVHPNTRLP